MSNDEIVTCMDCGEEIYISDLDSHVKAFHTETQHSKAKQRLQKSQGRNKVGIAVAVIGVLVILVFAGAYFGYYLPYLKEKEDLNNGPPQIIEDTPNIVVLPDPIDDTPPDGGDDDVPADDDTPDDDVPTDDDNEPVDDDDVPDDDDVEPEETVVLIPQSEITTTAKWYIYSFENVEIRYFLVRSNDQEIHVAFDSCDVCYEHNQGYYQEGVKVVCRYCGKSFPIKAIGEDNVAGGCWPQYLGFTIDDDNVYISTADLEEGKWMFRSEITTTAKWYIYSFENVEIRYFLVRSNDQEIHVAFDSCDVCYEHNQGYYQEGVKVVCRYCGKSFPIKAIGEDNVAGGCWPQPSQSAPSEDSLAKYEKALLQSYKDGQLSDTEARLLEQLRKRFNISQDEHDMLVAMHFD